MQLPFQLGMRHFSERNRGTRLATSTKRVQKLIAIADFELRKIGSEYWGMDRTAKHVQLRAVLHITMYLPVL